MEDFHRNKAMHNILPELKMPASQSSETRTPSHLPLPIKPE
jgi:hypothetical protein